MRRSPLNHRLAPDGESHRDVQARMIEALRSLRLAVDDDAITVLEA
ncbi:hypothetical protein AAEX63_11075 [Luteococcus sp. H138]